MPIAGSQAGGIYIPLLAALAALALSGAALNARLTTQAKAIAVVEQRAERADLTRVLRQMTDCPRTYQKLCVESHPPRKIYDRDGLPINEKFFEIVDVDLLSNGEFIEVARPEDRNKIEQKNEQKNELGNARLNRDKT